MKQKLPGWHAETAEARKGMLKERKYELVDELAEQLKAADTLILADYRGMAVADLEKLRAELYTRGTRFRIVKNTLTLRASEKAGVDLSEFLAGPTAIAFVTDGDMVAAAKTLVAMAKETKVLTFKGGVLEGRKLNADDIDTLAKLPPFDELQGLVVGVIAAPLTYLVSVLSAPMRDMVGVIDARRGQLEERGETGLELDASAGSEPEVEAAPGAKTEAGAEAVLEPETEAVPDLDDASAPEETTDANASKEDEDDGNN